MSQANAPVARLAGTVKRYGALTALDGADLVVRRGELLALLGPNGAGKSTAIGLMLGLIAGYGPRWLDAILVLTFDSLNSLPMIMFALAIIPVIGFVGMAVDYSR